jgi:putative PIN family toxin of toxin-antitoxin system
MNVVIDTNVFLSSFLSSRGSPRKIIDRWKRGDIAWCLCAEILEEYGDVLARFGLSESPEFAQLRELFKARRHIVWAVIANELRVVLADPDDDKFIECALSTGAAYLVSGDRHLRVLERYQGIRIVSPAEFLRRIDA